METYDNSRLRRNFPSVVCEGRCKASVVEHSLRPEAFVQCEGDNEVSGGRFVGNKAAKTTLLGYISSSMSAQPPPKSRDKWNKVCSQQPGKPVSSLHPFIPQPQGDERPGTYLRRNISEVRRALDITRNCVTAAQSQPTKPKPLHNRSLC